jgi:hypothetical protein
MRSGRRAIRVERRGRDVLIEIAIRNNQAIAFVLMASVVLGVIVICFIFTVPPPQSQRDIVFVTCAVAFFAVYAWGLWSIFSHGALRRERIEVTRPRIIRTERLLRWTRNREILEFHGRVQIDEGRMQAIARMHREDESPEVAPHGFTLRSGAESLWIGRRAWRLDHRDALRTALRDALRHHGVWSDDRSE